MSEEKEKGDIGCIYRLDDNIEDILGNEIVLCFKINDCEYKSYKSMPYYVDSLQQEQEGEQYRCLYVPRGG